MICTTKNLNKRFSVKQKKTKQKQKKTKKKSILILYAHITCINI